MTSVHGFICEHCGAINAGFLAEGPPTPGVDVAFTRAQRDNIRELIAELSSHLEELERQQPLPGARR